MKGSVGAPWLLNVSLTLWAGGPAAFSVAGAGGGGDASQLHTLWPAANGKRPSVPPLAVAVLAQLELSFPEAKGNWAAPGSC